VYLRVRRCYFSGVRALGPVASPCAAHLEASVALRVAAAHFLGTVVFGAEALSGLPQKFKQILRTHDNGVASFQNVGVFGFESNLVYTCLPPFVLLCLYAMRWCDLCVIDVTS
jgi:hypothetical protein